jgi:hypothetical protein
MRSVMEPEPTPPAQMEAPGPAMPPQDEATQISAADAARAAHDHAAALAAEAAAAQAAVAAAEAAGGGGGGPLPHPP